MTTVHTDVQHRAPMNNQAHHSDHERPASARTQLRRGALCSALTSLVISVSTVVIVMLDGFTHLYVLVLMGVAAGGAMATQVPFRSKSGGVVAMGTTATFMVVTVPLLALAAVLREWGAVAPQQAVGEIERAYAEVGGLVGAYQWMADAGGLTLVAYAAGALVLALALGRWLGYRDGE